MFNFSTLTLSLPSALIVFHIFRTLVVRILSFFVIKKAQEKATEKAQATEKAKAKGGKRQMLVISSVINYRYLYL